MKPSFLLKEVFATLYITSVLVGVVDSQTLKEVVEGESDLSTLADVLSLAGFDDEFGNPDNDPVTLCSPVNAAFEKLSPERYDQLLELQFIAHLRNVLEVHGVPGLTRAEQVTDGLMAPTLNEEVLTFEFVENTALGTTDVFVSTPNTPGIGSQVIEPNLEANNGIAHKIDTVLLPDFWDKDLVEAVFNLNPAEYSIFQDLVAASDMAVFMNTLSIGTILVPTDDAFLSYYGEEGIEELKLGDVVTLNQVLEQHIIPDVVLPAQLLEDSQAYENVAGEPVMVEVVESDTGGGGQEAGGDDTIISFNGAQVVDVNELANNGVIHGIDDVLVTSHEQEQQFPAVEWNPSGPCGEGSVREQVGQHLYGGGC